MEASPEFIPPSNRRESRYVRRKELHKSLGPIHLCLLEATARVGVAVASQLALLAGVSAKSARRHLRDLYDLDLVHVVPVTRAALEATSDINDYKLLHGSAPNIYQTTHAGMKALVQLALIPAERRNPAYGPRNSMFLSHELAVTDVAVWLFRIERMVPGCSVRTWTSGRDTKFELTNTHRAKTFTPDAWFALGMLDKTLVGLVEVDQGTERGLARWKQKIDNYRSLFAGDMLEQVTGYKNARVLVICPTVKRCDAVATLIQKHAVPTLSRRFWIAESAVLNTPCLDSASWKVPGSDILRPLISVAQTEKDTNKDEK